MSQPPAEQSSSKDLFGQNMEPGVEFQIIKKLLKEQDQVIDQLDQLNLGIERLLEEINASRQKEAESALTIPGENFDKAAA